MSALIKIFPGTSRASRYLQFHPSEDTGFHPTRELMGMAVTRTEILKDKERYSISLGTLSTDKYHALVSVNPHLVPFIQNLSLASAWGPNTTGQLWISFTATRTIDLGSIGPIVTVYLVD